MRDISCLSISLWLLSNGFLMLNLKKSAEVIVPIWMKLHKHPFKYWGKSLEKITSIVGTFMKVDPTTEQRTRLAYNRVLVQVKMGTDLPRQVIDFSGEVHNKETIIVEYECQPLQCKKCLGFGHISLMCKGNDRGLKVSKPGQPPTVQPVVSADAPHEQVQVSANTPQVMQAISNPPDKSIMLTLARLLSQVYYSHEGIAGHTDSFLEVVKGRVLYDGSSMRVEGAHEASDNG
ncbi:hypothetical protein vseg_010886 [Gypsophila vaccaria]